MRVSLLGIDPGLVDTGFVIMNFDTHLRDMFIESIAFNNNTKANFRIDELMDHLHDCGHVLDEGDGYVEAYRERGNSYSTDSRMRDMLNAIKTAEPRLKILDNTGVKQVVTPKLMAALNVWVWKTRTNHNDLRSAARIALYGGLKKESTNRVITQVVEDLLDGNPWNVTGN